MNKDDMMKGIHRMLYDKQTSHKDRELLRVVKKYIEKEPEHWLDWGKNQKHAFVKIWSDGSMSLGLHDDDTDIKHYMPLSKILKGIADSMYTLMDWGKVASHRG